MAQNWQLSYLSWVVLLWPMLYSLCGDIDHRCLFSLCLSHAIQYDGSNDDLDWRIDFRYLNFVCIIKYLRSRLIKGCFIEWKCLRLSNFNLRLDLIKTSFFKVLTYLNRSGGKFYMVLKKKSAQSVYFYRFYGHFKFCPKINLHNFCL